MTFGKQKVFRKCSWFGFSTFTRDGSGRNSYSMIMYVILLLFYFIFAFLMNQMEKVSRNFWLCRKLWKNVVSSVQVSINFREWNGKSIGLRFIRADLKVEAYAFSLFSPFSRKIAITFNFIAGLRSVSHRAHSANAQLIVLSEMIWFVFYFHVICDRLKPQSDSMFTGWVPASKYRNRNNNQQSLIEQSRRILSIWAEVRHWTVRN